MKEALCDSGTMRAFVGIDLWREPVLDEATICQCRPLPEAYGLGGRLLERVGAYLEEDGSQVSRGTIVDATLNRGALVAQAPRPAP